MVHLVSVYGLGPGDADSQAVGTGRQLSERHAERLDLRARAPVAAREVGGGDHLVDNLGLRAVFTIIGGFALDSPDAGGRIETAE